MGTQSDSQKNTIKIDRFMNGKYLKKDSLIALIFLLVFLATGRLESNWFLPNDDLGFLEHKSIWIFLLANFLVPIIVSLLFKILEYNIDKDSLKKLKVNFKDISGSKATTILQQFSKTVGFCCFIGNSLQNAHLINKLPFDYWDSINYLSSYIASRFYKLYLFAFFIPTVLIYGYILLKSVQKTIEKSSDFVENYEQVNALCNFGLNILLVLVIPFIISSITVYSIHDRFDITTITTIIASGACTLTTLVVYAFLIKSFYISISQYKRENIKKINSQLTKIHRYVLNYKLGVDDKTLDVYLKKEECLCRIKENIVSISKCPHIVKAIFTIVSPMIPSFLKLLFTLKYTP